MDHINTLKLSNISPINTTNTQNDQGAPIRQSIYYLNQLIANWDSPNAEQYWENFLYYTPEDTINLLSSADRQIVNLDMDPLDHAYGNSDQMLKAAGEVLCDLSIGYLHLAQQNPANYPLSPVLSNRPDSIATTLSQLSTSKELTSGTAEREEFETDIAYGQLAAALVFPQFTAQDVLTLSPYYNSALADVNQPTFNSAWSAFQEKLNELTT